MFLAAYENLPSTDQMLHGVHFMLCAFALLIACVPLLTPKGSVEHKFGGMIYLPVSAAALLLASYVAWREASLVLFCFNSFCAYLLLSGWRATHEKERPELIDWLIPSALFALAVGVALCAVMGEDARRTFFLLFFSLNAMFLAWRDWQHLRRRLQSFRASIALADAGNVEALPSMAWLNRHVAGMVGSVLANLSVIALTLLPLELHWLWPTALTLAAGTVWWREEEKKRRVRAALAQFIQPKFRPAHARRADDIKRAA